MDLPDPEADPRNVPAQVDEQAYEDVTEQLHDSENEEEDLEATDPEGSSQKTPGASAGSRLSGTPASKQQSTSVSVDTSFLSPVHHYTDFQLH